MTGQPPPRPQHTALREALPTDVGKISVRLPSVEDEIMHRATVDAVHGAPVAALEDRLGPQFAVQFPYSNRRVAVQRLPDGSDRVLGGYLRMDADLSIPGGWVPVGVLTALGVDPSAHDCGVASALITEHLNDCGSSGDAASVWVGVPPGRPDGFGYGQTAEATTWQIDAADAALRPDAPSSGPVQWEPVQLEPVRGRALHAEVDRLTRAAGDARPATLMGEPTWWASLLMAEESTAGTGPRLVALHRSGFALFRVDGGAVAERSVPETGSRAESDLVVTIDALAAADTAAELDLWRYLAGLSGVRRIRWRNAPVDPAVQFWLRDPDRIRRSPGATMLLRPVDMPRLVAERRYGRDARVKLVVNDPVFARNHGRFDLAAGSWEPGAGAADLHVDIADLGALWLGRGSARQLLATGRISGQPEAAADLDALLGTGLPPRILPLG